MNKNLHNVADLERIKELEAEVERLRHLGGAPPGVSPSPPLCVHCGWPEKSSHHDVGWANHRFTPTTRKERDG